MPRVTITVPDATPQPYRFDLDRRKVTLGRGSDNDIAIASTSVSVKHAEMVRADSGYELRDIGSTNGTKVDGERRMTVPLHSGITVHLGDVAFDFELSAEEAAAIAAEAAGSGAASIPRSGLADEEDSLASASATSGKSGVMMILLFILLAGAAFAVGMMIRHNKEKPPAENKPAASAQAPAPAAEPAAPAGDASAPAESAK